MKRLRQISLTSKIFLMLVIIIGTFAVYSGFSVKNWRIVNRSFERLNHHYMPLLEDVSEISLDISILRSELFRFLNGYESTPYRIMDILDRTETILSDLHEDRLPDLLVSSNQEILALLSQYRLAITQLQEYVEKEQYIQISESTSRLAEMGTTVLWLSRKIKNDLWGIIEKENVLARQRIQRIHFLLSVFTAAGFFLGFVFMIFLQRDIRSGFKALHEGISELTHRREKTHIEINRQDEIGKLAERFNAMAKELERQERESRRLSMKLQQAQKMKAIGTLAGGVAHDLNNILSGLVSYPELILMDLPEDSPIRGSIRTIQKSGEKAAALVQDLLTLARRGVKVKEVISLNTVIHDYLKSYEFTALDLKRQGIVLKTELEENLLNILGSPVHLSKTLMNLVSNAVDAMSSGGTLQIRSNNRYVDFSIRGYDDVSEGEYVVLEVSDTGCGIASEDIDRIFEPFYTKKEMGLSGTGLGMAVVWGTVKDHEGYIDVSSSPGKGTVFTLYFPCTRESLSCPSPGIGIDALRGKGESVLIIDDIPTQREIASALLLRLGYSVHTAESGEAALHFLKRNPVDLVLLDMIMEPGMDGLDTYRGIIKMHPRQKAVIVSGYSETERVQEAQKLGAGVYIKKPYLLETLGAAVRDELDRSGTAIED